MNIWSWILTAVFMYRIIGQAFIYLQAKTGKRRQLAWLFFEWFLLVCVVMGSRG